MLRQPFEAGVDTRRLDFSHGERWSHEDIAEAIRALETKISEPIGILQDFQGPKFRLD